VLAVVTARTTAAMIPSNALSILVSVRTDSRWAPFAKHAAIPHSARDKGIRTL
jgi:hypothetical protein